MDTEFENYRSGDGAFDRIRNDSLIVYSFVGNDLFHPNGDARGVVTELAESLARLVARSQIPHVMVTMSNGVRFTPFTNAIPEPRRSAIVALGEEFKHEWGRQLPVLRRTFPNTTFYEFHGQSFWQNLTFGPIPGTSRSWINHVACLTPVPGSEPPASCPARGAFQPAAEPACASVAQANLTLPSFNVCPDPDAHVFWDDIHPTAVMHRHIASHMLEVLQGKTFS